MNINNLINASQLAKELKVSAVTAKTILQETGEGVSLGNSVFYDRDKAKVVVWRRSVATLDFLGLPLSPRDSYDVIVDHSEIETSYSPSEGQA